MPPQPGSQWLGARRVEDVLSLSPAPKVGTRGVFVDSIADAEFLASGTGTGGTDMGLGVTDDPKFVFSSYVNPTTTKNRAFPVKFFWLGSPAGTNDSTDAFSVYMADVDTEAFYPGAPASVWLRNPRLVLSIAQAKSDIIAWFDSNYPGGATNGVGSSNTGTNTAYGMLSGAGNVGNVSALDSLAGEYWPIYDRVDGGWILYFSIKTPNVNTAAMYVYKTSDTEISTPLGASQFLGGLSPSQFQSMHGGEPGGATVLNGHRFSIMAPEPLRSDPAAGKLAAVFVYSNICFDSVNPSHGNIISWCLIADLHATPASPAVSGFGSNSQISNPSTVANLDGDGIYPVDKCGQIVALTPISHEATGYAMIYNAPSARDVRSGSNAVVISSMALRVVYFNPAICCIGFGSQPLKTLPTDPDRGSCRASFTTMPDGVPKLVYANWFPDQYLNLGYEYVNADLLDPAYQKEIYVLSGGNSAWFYSWGKRDMKCLHFVRSVATPNPSLAAGPVIINIRETVEWDPNTGNSALWNWAARQSFRHILVARDASSLRTSQFTLKNIWPFVLFQWNNTANLSIFARMGDYGEDPIPESQFSYLTSGGGAIATSDGLIHDFGFLNPLGLQTAKFFSDWLSNDEYSEMVVNITVQSATGTTPALTMKLHCLDPYEPSNSATTLANNPYPSVLALTLNGTPINAAAVVRLVISKNGATVWVNGTKTDLGNLTVPQLWQLEFDITGTFAGGQGFGILATYELRR